MLALSLELKELFYDLLFWLRLKAVGAQGHSMRDIVGIRINHSEHSPTYTCINQYLHSIYG